LRNTPVIVHNFPIEQAGFRPGLLFKTYGMTTHMDLDLVIERLQTERLRLDEIIHSLEELRTAVPANVLLKDRRGRKFMGEAERRQVAIRIKNYWAAQRQLKHAQLSLG
jgi:hypothetical protein